MCSIMYRVPKDRVWQVHRGAGGSESAMALKGGYPRVRAGGSCYWPESDSSSSESMLGGSGSASNDGVPLGVNFSPVNVNAPEPCRKVERAVIPLGVLSFPLIMSITWLSQTCSLVLSLSPLYDNPPLALNDRVSKEFRSLLTKTSSTECIIPSSTRLRRAGPSLSLCRRAGASSLFGGIEQRERVQTTSCKPSTVA